MEKWNRVHPFGSGHINDTYKVHFADKNYLLQRLNHHVFQSPEKVMDNIALVAKYLEEKINFPYVLKPLPTIEGHLFFKDNTHNYWRVFPFFENTATIEVIENSKQAFEGAKAYGGFTKALKNISPDKIAETIPDFHNGLKRVEAFQRAIIKGEKSRLNRAALDIQFLKDHLGFFYKIAALDLPIRICHNDTKIGNVLFGQKKEKAIAVIDWDTLMPATILADFGDMVRTFATAGKEDEADLEKVYIRPEILEAIEHGYVAGMGDLLTPVEKTHLLDGAKWMILMQAMRFLTDFLLGNAYYKIAYEEHNLVRTRNQIRLFQSLVSFQINN